MGVNANSFVPFSGKIEERLMLGMINDRTHPLAPVATKDKSTGTPTFNFLTMEEYPLAVT